MAKLSLFIDQLLKHEGGFVNHPDDPGGATNKGITFNTFQLYGEDVDDDGDIDVEDLKIIPTDLAKKIYKDRYWDVMRGDNFESQKMAEIVMDLGVNAGMKRAIRMLQFILRKRYVADVWVDGVIGPQTISATNITTRKGNKLYNDYLEMRKDYYNFLAGRTEGIDANTQWFFRDTLKVGANSRNESFINGWLNRLWYFEKKK